MTTSVILRKVAFKVMSTVRLEIITSVGLHTPLSVTYSNLVEFIINFASHSMLHEELLRLTRIFCFFRVNLPTVGGRWRNRSP